MLRRAFTLLLAAALAWAGLGASPLHAAEPAQVIRNEAVSDFGSAVTFELEAEASEQIVDVVLLYALGSASDEDLPAYTEAMPEWQPGTRISASFERDTAIDYLPVGVMIRYRWLITQADGTVTETEEQQLIYDDTRFDWRERTERNITIRWYGADDDWGQALMDSAIAGLERLEERVGGSVDGPMRITVYNSTNDMRAALPPNSADWIGGQAQPGLGLIIGSIAPGDDVELERLVPHELSHLVLHQATKNNYGGMPVWFDEGLAVNNQTYIESGFAQRVDRAARNGELIPLSALASNFPSDPEKALQSYAQSASVVAYIEETYGVEAIAGLVAAFRNGNTDDMAVQTVLGRSLDTLDAEWRATLPATESTPEPVERPNEAPANRFSDEPVVVGESGEIVSGGGEEIPWGLVMVGAGVLLMLIAGAVLLQQRRRA